MNSETPDPNAGPVDRLLAEFIAEREAGAEPEPLPFLARCADSGERSLLADLIGELEELDARRPTVALPASLGVYRIIGHLGRGGMGMVFRGEDPSGRPVAIKQLPPNEFDGGLTERFAREMQILRNLDHPAIVPVLETGESSGRPFLVLPYFAGGSLEDHLEAARASGKPPTTAELRAGVRVIHRVAGAAAEAHRRNVVHRDIKPSNILFDAQGRAHLADFGLAHAAELSTMTAPDRIVGTIGYLAPELVNDPAARNDPRVDVYGLGISLYETLTRHRPYEGTLTEILAAIHRGPPSPSLFLRRPLNTDLASVLERSMDPDPQRRYQTMEAFADDLDRWLAGERVLARRGRVWRRLRRHVRSHPKLASAVTILLLALSVIIAWTTFDRRSRLESVLRVTHAHIASLGELLEELHALRRVAIEDETFAWSRGDGGTFDPAGSLDIRNDIEQRLELIENEYEETLRLLDVAMSEGAMDERLLDLHRQVRRSAAAWMETEGHHLNAKRHWLALGLDADSVERHATLSLETIPPNARVRIFRYDLDSREIVWPSIPVGQEQRTPVHLSGLAPGSYRFELQRPGQNRWIAYPIWIQSHNRLDPKEPIRLPTDEEIGSEWVYVPPGDFVAGGDHQARGYEPRATRFVPGFFIKRHEETMADYFEFLDALVAAGKPCWDNPWRWEAPWPEHLPNHTPRRTAYGTPLVDWEPESGFTDSGGYAHPENVVHGISPRDAEHYVAWLNRRAEERGEPWIYALPTSDQWEKATRGVDGRPFPWGERFAWDLTSGAYTPAVMPFADEDRLKPGQFPKDRSPFGLLDGAGNVREICRETRVTRTKSGSELSFSLVRGGEESFRESNGFRLAARLAAYPTEVNWDFGIRLVRTYRDPISEVGSESSRVEK